MVVDITSILNNVYTQIGFFFYIISCSFIPLPGESIVIASYGVFANSFSNLVQVILLVFIASVIGDIGTYFLARTISEKVGRFIRKFKFFRNNEEKVIRSLRKHFFLFVFFSRFIITGVGPIVNYLSGFEKLDSKKFILAVVSGELIYAIVPTTLGYLFKDTWNELLNFVDYSLTAIVLSLVGIYVLYRIIKRLRKKGNLKS